MWQRAGRVWTDDLRLRDPIMLDDRASAMAQHAEETLACINALSFETLLNLDYMRTRGVARYLSTFMAHEIGHHVIAPAGFTNQMRYLAAVSLIAPADRAAMYVNLALDLLINDELVSVHQLPCDAIYRALCAGSDPVRDAAYSVMLGAMEQLWPQSGPLFERPTPGQPPFAGYQELVDALCATYALHGKGQRGSELVPYVTLCGAIFERARERAVQGGHAQRPGQEGPTSWDQLQGMSADEETREALRRWLRSGGMLSVEAALRDAQRALGSASRIIRGEGSAERMPYVPQLMKNLLAGTGFGELVSGSELVIAYYELMANAHLMTFLSDRGGHSEGYPESLREWTWGDPLEELDWMQSAIRSGQPIPGVNTVSWEYGYELEPRGAEPFPVDLDLYIDTSGSMPDPHTAMSHIALGAFIFALSVLRQGGAVRVTIWSMDMQNLLSMHHFSTDREEVLTTLCHAIRGGTQFPVKHWEEAIARHEGRANFVHTVILSDNDIFTWFHGSYPTERVERCLEEINRAFGAGGTVILNGDVRRINHTLPEGWLVRGCATWDAVVQTCADVAARRFSTTR